MINKIKPILCIYKDPKQLFCGDFLTAVNTESNDKNIIILIVYCGNHNVSWLQIYLSIKFGTVGAKFVFDCDDDFAKKFERQSALAYYYNQIKGWYDISIPEFEQILRNASKIKPFRNIALSKLNKDSY